MGAEDRALIRELRDALAAQACPSQAEAMQRYMKSELPFYGLKAEPLRKTCKQVLSRHPLPWALRQHAWTDPEIIEDYVRRHETRLSPLSKREALKNVARRRARGAVKSR